MNFNLNLKDILNFFTKISFKIAFFIGVFIYKIFFLDKNNGVANIVINILFTISIIFLVDAVIEKIIKFTKNKKVLYNYKRNIRKLSEPQIQLLVSNYLDIEKENVIINPIAYFNLQRGQFQILLSKGIIFQAASMQTSLCFPFSLQELAYNELEKAIHKKKITYSKHEDKCIVNWYGRKISFKMQEDYDEEYY